MVHVLRKSPRDDCAVALWWTPEGRRKRGRPKTAWRRMVKVEKNGANWSSWNTARRPTTGEEQCLSLVCPLTQTELS